MALAVVIDYNKKRASKVTNKDNGESKVIDIEEKRLSSVIDFYDMRLSEVIEDTGERSSSVIYDDPIKGVVIYDVPFKIRVQNITVPGYSPTNVPPIGIAIIGINNYIL
jgi:hypothetical protein